MPINYKEYSPKWHLISRLIRRIRAKNKCEKCKVKNHSHIIRNKYGYTYVNMNLPCNVAEKHSKTGKKIIKVVLTVAHLDHDIANNDFSNLMALCQKCHLNHDAKHHANNRKYGKLHNGNHQLKINLI